MAWQWRARTLFTKLLGCACSALTCAGAAGCTSETSAEPQGRSAAEPRLAADEAAQFPTTTPIKHVVVVFGENISFDHYFGTYPRAENRPGEPVFHAAPETPSANNLETPLDPLNDFAPVPGLDLLRLNPNFTNPENGSDATNPLRLGPAQASTQGMVHNYTPEQQAAHGGAMDLFPKFTGNPGVALPDLPQAASRGLVMAYFDGNTVSALWNFAQGFAMNDNSWTSTFGPSTPGAINLISGQTNGFDSVYGDVSTYSTGDVTPDGNGGFTMIGDPQPLGDVCSMSSEQVALKGRNIGDLLNARGITWGWFEGGFDLGITNPNETTHCSRSTGMLDYIPHHQPFQYYASTANPSHARPSATLAIGSSFERDGSTPDPANHQYDSHDFFRALRAGNFPAVSYLKAPGFEDGHAGYSNPLDEQNFIVEVVAAVQATPEWSSTAIILAYDDSDGWYDHQAPPIVNPSNGVADALNGDGLCNDAGAQQRGPAPAIPLLGRDGKPALGRCGYGTRVPLLVVSPFAKKNYIDHTLTDQTSILRFIEDNWLGGERIQPGASFDTIAGTLENLFQF